LSGEIRHHALSPDRRALRIGLHELIGGLQARKIARGGVFDGGGPMRPGRTKTAQHDKTGGCIH
jgi:hypothetical protein